MAEENIPSQSFNIRELSTKTVTLYPARAHVVREIPSIALQPGQNEIEIYGLAETIDEQSLQIEGTGNGEATITDITVEKVINKIAFDDVCGPPEELDDDDLESDYSDSDDDADDVKISRQERNRLNKAIETQADLETSCSVQLYQLEQFTKTITNEFSDAKKLEEALHVYESERSRLHLGKTNAGIEIEKLTKQKSKVEWRLKRAEKAEKEKNKEAVQAKDLARRKKLREREQRHKEIEKVRSERATFWPAYVYRVVVRLETAMFTPGPSRRSSIGSITLSKEVPESSETPEKSEGKVTTSPNEISLSLSYVTTGAFWLPWYDLSINSVKKTASIVYRAEVRNATSETWTDAKVILSTSQTSYSGLDDKAPTMHPWQVALSRYNPDNDGIFSKAEISATQAKIQKEISSQAKAYAHAAPQQNRHVRSSVASHQLGGNRMQMIASAPNVELHRGISSARKSKKASILPSFGAARSAPPGAAPAASNVQEYAYAGYDPTIEDCGESLDALAPTALDFEESAWEDYGLTATYDLPGTRTLAPSTLARRYKIATLNATSIALSHIAIPKLRAAAFLRAKLKNPSSSVTLLKGTAGITLDGSFLGTHALARVSPNQAFTIPLGVDPAIHISYPKPTLHRSTQGIFNKERAHVFSRSIFVTNTRPAPVELLVLDQVPLSQDERLRIDIVSPRGLIKEGDVVKTGAPAHEARKAWGKARATLKKDGEVAWTVEIEKSQAAVLKFEYEAKMPGTENMINS
ncbi:hypothetical protein BT63DRAFT_188208 [Microthyrium microscopicum]|uniref:DUF4139 domain-containing protein n=1 Tax=Microthyrium microscopicum TaxID=703497 RepID=A0A6A6UKV5_9PEZI|nr:hypothetical protein BT63DRAFT_188208 [Microthyrium microscopicum]